MQNINVKTKRVEGNNIKNKINYLNIFVVVDSIALTDIGYIFIESAATFISIKHVEAAYSALFKQVL